MFPLLATPAAVMLFGAQLFDYDQRTPIELEQRVFRERPSHTVFDITYRSPKEGRVTAFLVIPKAKGPHAGLVFGHWGPGNKTEFLPEAEPGLLDHAGLMLDLSELLGRKVDLVSKNGLKPLIRDSVIHDARRVYAA